MKELNSTLLVLSTLHTMRANRHRTSLEALRRYIKAAFLFDLLSNQFLSPKMMKLATARPSVS